MNSTTLYVHHFLSAETFTIVVETVFLFFLLRYLFKKRNIPTLDILAAGFFASFSTIPYVWFAFPFLQLPGMPAYWSEPFAFVVEAIFYKMFLRLDWKLAFTVSLICNLASYAIGHFLQVNGIWFNW